MVMRRVLNDYYPTPEPVTQILLDKVDIAGTVFEPCAGHNAITKMLERQPNVVKVWCSDLVWEVPTGHTTNDATTEQFWKEWEQYGIDWTVTNPPFSEAETIIPHAWNASDRGIAMLLRLSYLEPCNGRGDWMKQHSDFLKYAIVFNPRIKFRTDTSGSDSVTCAWLVWDKSWSWKKLGAECPFVFAQGWKK